VGIQRNVKQQAEATALAIKHAIALGASQPPWFVAMLRQHGLSPQAGILVRYAEIPEQEGNLQKGVWLSEASEFWEFEVLVSRVNRQALRFEKFLNATSSFPAVAGQPGTGPSFGHLALQALREAPDA